MQKYAVVFTKNFILQAKDEIDLKGIISELIENYELDFDDVDYCPVYDIGNGLCDYIIN